jgi:adenylate cyclase
VPLIISKDLKNQLIDNYWIRFLDEVLVKGKSHPMKIYEVIDFEPDNIKEIKENNQKSMEGAFSYYQLGEFLKENETIMSIS